jgi:hypothetical protein
MHNYLIYCKAFVSKIYILYLNKLDIELVNHGPTGKNMNHRPHRFDNWSDFLNYTSSSLHHQSQIKLVVVELIVIDRREIIVLRPQRTSALLDQ